MYKMTFALRPTTVVLLLLLPALLIGCGGGGSSSGSISALTLPSRIELSDVDGGQAGSASLFAQAYADSGTDYANQSKETWVKDTNALQMVNQVLGAVNGTAYQNYLNQGAYKALVKPVGEKGQSQGGGGTTSSTTESLMEITVEATRASASAPMLVKIWVVEEDGPGGNNMLIRGHFTVTQGVSTTYPYGVLEAHFKGTKLDSSGNEVSGDPLFTMAMSITAESGNVVIQFTESGSESGVYSWENKARVITNSDLTEGKAYIYSMEDDPNPGTTTTTHYFAFNSDYFKYQEVGGGSTDVFDKDVLSHRVYRYKLFEKDSGDAVTRNSGFPVEFGSGKHGYMGYYGAWAPFGVTLTNNMTVTRTETSQEYTLVKVGGKLTKHTRTSTTLGDLVGAEISVFDSGSDIIVSWDGSGFKKVGTRNNSTGAVTYITPEAYTFSNNWDGGWCESLQAFLRLGHLSSPSNSTTIYYHSQQVVNPATATDLTLYYWGFALGLPITQTIIDNSGTAMSSYQSGSPTKKTYFFDSANLLLKETDVNGTAVLMPSGLTLSSSMYSHGYEISPLTTSNSFNSSTCWDIYNESVYYTWSTGPNDWNQFFALKDGSNNYVTFDPPMVFTYTHTTANDLNGSSTYDGKKFNLQYDGSDLRVPWKYDSSNGEWAPLINLRDGTELSLSGTDYVVKGIEEELLMTQVTDSNVITALASTLPIDTGVAAPTLTYDATRTALVGSLPTGVTLKVIKGQTVTTTN